MLARARNNPTVVLAFAGLLLLIALLLWWADRPGAPATTLSPAANARDVSTLTTIRAHFEQEMDTDTVAVVDVQPAITGTVSWEGNSLVYRPDRPLEPETTYSVTIGAGLWNRQGDPLDTPITWQFHTAPLRILFMASDDQDRPQLYVTAATGGVITALTAAEVGVVDYSLSPDGRTIAYSAANADGGSDLWAVAADGSENGLLLACEAAQCRAPVWAPEGNRLLYERRAPGDGESTAPPRLWWLAPATGETVSLFENSEWLGQSAAFSADGRWLAYVVPLEERVQAFDLETREALTVLSSTGETPTWHPSETQFLVSDIAARGERLGTDIYKVTVSRAETTNLSGDLDFNDAAAVWSPDGSSIAFGRKVPRTPVGRQLWLMRADGSDQVALTADPDSNFSRPSWSPDGSLLLTQRNRIAAATAGPGVWLLDVESWELREVITPGYLPAWLP